ncbi:MAG: hypothetical protein AAFO84_12795, partial [Cyanobacteria bacterium J06598_1]
MKILHGTWIPDAHSDFVQAGAFYLWVETALPEHAASADHSQHLGPQHSGPQHSGPQHFGIQHLESAELAEFLSQELGFAAANTKAIAKDISPKFFYLPTAAEWPVFHVALKRFLVAIANNLPVGIGLKIFIHRSVAQRGNVVIFQNHCFEGLSVVNP